MLWKRNKGHISFQVFLKEGIKMNDELTKKIIQTQKQQTETIKELLAICTELVDRVKTLEENSEDRA